MAIESARAVADAVLYEGYVLYPYRASARKNHSRWQFGVVMPAAYAAAEPGESALCQAEMILEYDDDTDLDVVVRFLQVQQRTVDSHSPSPSPDVVGGVVTQPWDEAVEREFAIPASVIDLLRRDRHVTLRVTGGEDVEPVRDEGRIVRRRHPLHAVVTLSATVIEGPWRSLRLRVRVANRTQLTIAPRRRDEALPGALVAAHLIVSARNGAFVSMVDPPRWAADAVRGCRNIGCWPVLAGPPGGRDTVLASPIILYDHPEIAPESAGAMFDSTEIDEILALRTITLTDAEKREARATDPRAAAVIDRAEALDAVDLDRLHGTIRMLRPISPVDGGPGIPLVPEQGPVPWWDPDADTAVSPLTDTVDVAGVQVGSGSMVRLVPGRRRADAQDMFLAGRLARVEAVVLDVDDVPYLAVTLADDPAADLQRSHGRYLYFGVDEVDVP